MKKAIVGNRILVDGALRSGCILFEDGKILEVPEHLPDGFNGPVTSAGRWIVMPGLVDTHVHINEPGRTDWEGFQTATQSAAAGGITTLADMPLNCLPVTTTAEAFAAKREAVAGQLWVDCGFWGGVVPNSVPALHELLEAGVCGVKSFLIDSGIPEFPAMTEPDLRQAMAVLRDFQVPYLIHAELAPENGETPKIGRQYKSFLASRPRAWENRAIEMMIRLCRDIPTPIHIVHLSSAEGVPRIAEAKSEGVPVTVETCPHYLTFEAESIPDGKTLFKCCPPIREHANREALWRGLEEGHIDCIVSDHSPCTPNLKDLDGGDFDKAWGGISSLQFGLPLVWTQAKERGFPIAKLAEWMCETPARLMGFGHRKGRIAPGMDADFVIWDHEAKFTIEPEMIYHKHRITPYRGREVFGRVVHTILGGENVFGPVGISGDPLGKVLLRSH